jgi:hypothetical protein
MMLRGPLRLQAETSNVLSPFLFFWALVYFGREELGLKGAVLCILLWAILLAGCVFLGLWPYAFVALQAVFDAILVIIIFRGNIRIR